jgi:hypothetical protein
VNTIKVIDMISQDVIKTYQEDQREEAYSYAAELEQMGFDVRVVTPTLMDSFKSTLGLDVERLVDFEDSVREELEDHDGQELDDSCCYKPFSES